MTKTETPAEARLDLTLHFVARGFALTNNHNSPVPYAFETMSAKGTAIEVALDQIGLDHVASRGDMRIYADLKSLPGVVVAVVPPSHLYSRSMAAGIPVTDPAFEGVPAFAVVMNSRILDETGTIRLEAA